MSFFELTSLAAAIFHIVLTLFVLTRDLRSEVNRAYCLWGMSMVLWNVAAFMKYRASLAGDQIEILYYLRLLHLGVIFLPLTTFHIFLLVARISWPRLLAALYVVHFGFAASVFTPLYIVDVYQTDFGYVVKGGPTFYAFMVGYCLNAIVTIRMLLARQKTLSPIHRTRLRLVAVPYITMVAAGFHDLLPVLGYKTYPLTALKIHPLASLVAIFFGIAVAYGVLQHQLLNIHLTLSQLAARLVRITFMCLLGFALLLAFYGLAPGEFSGYSFFGALIMLLVTATLTSILFPKLFGKGEERLEQRLLGDQFEYQDKIAAFVQAIPAYVQAEPLLADLHDLLARTVGLRSYQLITLDELSRVFKLLRAHPEPAVSELPDLTLDSPIFRLFRTSRTEYLPYQLAYSMPGETALERAGRQDLRQFHPEFCFPFYSAGEPFGFLLIGEKASGDPYTARDLQLLIQMAKNLASVFIQIRLKNQLLLNERMELLGTMSRGMAHDLNNLVTPISTYLQIAAAGNGDRATTEELLPEAMRNLETMRAYIRESLFFSRTLSLNLSRFCLDRTIHKAVELAQPALKQKGLVPVVHSPANLLVEMDEVLILRLLGNLLSNAIDASTAGAPIQIRTRWLGKTEAQREWLRLLVIDQGEGISPENLKRVATPYFTTKDRGSQARGFGLGLAISRKIVHLHGGNFSIASRPRQGTTIQIDLPDRQIGLPSLAVPVAT